MASNSNVIGSYLVSLGFSPDMISYGKFTGVLRDAASQVQSQAGSVAQSFMKWQTSVIGGFAAAGAAALGIVDKVAMADQEYRLFGLRMYTTTSTARELKVAMDALGQPLENIAWDPELSARFSQLVKDQQAMTQTLGPGFERQMVAVRNMRFEFTRFGVEMEYLTMNLVKDFAKILGFDPDQLLDKLKSANQWVISNMPEITGWIEERLTPALNDVKLILSDTWDLLKLSGVAFSNLVGAISGDKSLEGTAANFDKISSAIQKSLDGITNFTSGIIHSEEVLLHLVNAASLAKSGNMKEAMGELNTAWKMYSSGSLEAGLGKAAGTFGFAFGPSNQKLMQDVGTLFGGAIEDYRGKSPIAGAAPEYARSAAIALGLPPGADKWILAQEKVETANFTSPATMRNNLGGIMDTRHGGGIKPFGTLDDYNSEYIKTVMGDIKRFGKTPQSMDEFVQMLYAGGKKAYVQSGTPQDYLAGMQRYSGGDQSVQIDNLTIHVAGTNATPDQIKKATTEGISAAVSKQVQRNIQEFAGAYQ